MIAKFKPGDIYLVPRHLPYIVTGIVHKVDGDFVTGSQIMCNSEGKVLTISPDSSYYDHDLIPLVPKVEVEEVTLP